MKNSKKQLTAAQSSALLSTLKTRFEKNPNRHKAIEWAKVAAKLEADNEKCWSLNEMENTGGEPDVVAFDTENRLSIFFMIVQQRVLQAAEVFVMMRSRVAIEERK